MLHFHYLLLFMLSVIAKKFRSAKLFKTYIDFVIHGQGDNYRIKSAYNTANDYFYLLTDTENIVQLSNSYSHSFK